MKNTVKYYLNTNEDAVAVAAQAFLQKYMKEIDQRGIAHCSAPGHMFINQLFQLFIETRVHVHMLSVKH